MPLSLSSLKYEKAVAAALCRSPIHVWEHAGRRKSLALSVWSSIDQPVSHIAALPFAVRFRWAQVTARLLCCHVWPCVAMCGHVWSYMGLEVWLYGEIDRLPCRELCCAAIQGRVGDPRSWLVVTNSCISILR